MRIQNLPHNDVKNKARKFNRLFVKRPDDVGCQVLVQINDQFLHLVERGIRIDSLVNVLLDIFDFGTHNFVKNIGWNFRPNEPSLRVLVDD